MKARYELKNGEILELFLWNDILENKDFVRESVKVSNLTKKTKGRIYKLVSDETNNKYFVYNKEKVYLKNFLAMPYEELVEKLKEDVFLNEDEILATFLKEPEKIIAKIELYTYDSIIPHLGIGFTSDKTMEMICIPMEKTYSRYQWSYKIEFQALEDDMRLLATSRKYYFSDFVSNLKRKSITLITKQEYEEFVIQQMGKEYNKTKNGLSSTIKNKINEIISK